MYQANKSAWSRRATSINQNIHQPSVDLLSESPSYDDLTGLLDRKSFICKAKKVIAEREYDVVFSLLDLDKLKKANDHFGHSFGDRYIQLLGEQISKTLNSKCFAGRMGGDEFAILFVGDGTKRASITLESIRRCLVEENPELQKFGLGGVSIGQCQDENRQKSFETLYREADVALYAAKECGRNQNRVYSSYVMERYDAILQKKLLNEAIAAGNFQTIFRPVSHLSTERIAGYQVDGRIRTNERKIFGKNRFEKALKYFDCARNYSQLLLEEGVEWWSRMRMLLPAGSFICFNITKFDLSDLEYTYLAEETLRAFSVPPSEVIFNIPDEAFDADFEDGVVTTLKRIRNTGCKISISDFAKAYPTLVSVNYWEVDYIELCSSSLSKSSQPGANSFAILSILSIANELSIEIIADGVQDGEFLDQLMKSGVSFGKGNFVGWPHEASALLALLESRKKLDSSKSFLAGHKNESRLCTI